MSIVVGNKERQGGVYTPGMYLFIVSLNVSLFLSLSTILLPLDWKHLSTYLHMQSLNKLVSSLYLSSLHVLANSSFLSEGEFGVVLDR